MDELRPEMSPEEFRLMRELVYQHCGIALHEEYKFMMERRLWPRAEALGFADWTSYHRFLRYDVHRQAELEAAIESITTHETYFFREQPQLTAFFEQVLPELAQRNERVRQLRLWSAGCSSGEEAYTLAMLVMESCMFAGWDVQIYGTDISRRVLALARKGEYGSGALRSLPPSSLLRWFDPLPGGRQRVREEVRALVSFASSNLLDASSLKLLPRMDVVFCRNVMIYFDVPARRVLLKNLYERMVEEGLLFLGHSESLLNLSTDFEPVALAGDLAYRRPAGAHGGRSP